MKHNFSKILILISIIFFLFSCFVFVFLYKAVNQNNQKAQVGLQAWQTEVERRNEINALNSSLAEVSNDRSLIDSHFTQSSNVVPFLNTIEQLGTTAGSVLEITAVNTGTNNSQLVVSLKATGTFQQIYRFLTLLENSPYELDFLSMSMHKLTVADIAQLQATSVVPVKNTKTPPKIVSSIPMWEGDFQVQLLSFTP